MEISYRIENIEEVSYSLNFHLLNKGIDKSGIGFRIGHEINVQKETSEIFTTVYVFVIDQHNNTELASESVRATFYISPFDEVVKSIGKDGIEVSGSQLIDTFINVTIGAIRGMMVKNFRGTPLDGCVLPLIPMQIIRKNTTQKKK